MHQNLPEKSITARIVSVTSYNAAQTPRSRSRYENSLGGRKQDLPLGSTPFRRKLKALSPGAATSAINLVFLSLVFSIFVLKFFAWQKSTSVLQRFGDLKQYSSSLRPTALPNQTALVTLTDPVYQYCALDLLRSARQHGWRHDMFILTTGVHLFDMQVLDELQELSARVIETSEIFEDWLSRKIPNPHKVHKLEHKKLRKMEVFFNPILRAFDRILFLDADGTVQAPLDPFLNVEFPEKKFILARQNDASIGKGTFYENELQTNMLTSRQLEYASMHFPDRELSTATSWFVVDMRKLPSAEVLLAKIIEILCNFRAAFKYNDQTLINILFYDNISMFPYCVIDEVPVLDTKEELQAYCDNMHLRKQEVKLGKDTDNAPTQVEFVYNHMYGPDKGQCIRRRDLQRQSVWDSKIDAIKVNTHGMFNVSRFSKPSSKAQGMSCIPAYLQWRREKKVWCKFARVLMLFGVERSCFAIES